MQKTGAPHDFWRESNQFHTPSAQIIIDIDAITAYNLRTFTSEPIMASLTIRNLDTAIKERLRVQAAEHGRSMEAEARRILQDALKASAQPPELNLYDLIRARVEPLGGVELELPPRHPVREPPTFE